MGSQAVQSTRDFPKMVEKVRPGLDLLTVAKPTKGDKLLLSVSLSLPLSSLSSSLAAEPTGAESQKAMMDGDKGVVIRRKMDIRKKHLPHTNKSLLSVPDFYFTSCFLWFYWKLASKDQDSSN
ncbi:hypothetical protein BHE74_00042219 [Ensete ventricosum]|nr:hypothetical protein GW17_00037125 [Ensete ventricosum]RWW51440.1 hypothetical protein BHE74_00042219 [Ensete ventricosum]